MRGKRLSVVKRNVVSVEVENLTTDVGKVTLKSPMKRPMATAQTSSATDDNFGISPVKRTRAKSSTARGTRAMQAAENSENVCTMSKSSPVIPRTPVLRSHRLPAAPLDMDKTIGYTLGKVSTPKVEKVSTPGASPRRWYFTGSGTAPALRSHRFAAAPLDMDATIGYTLGNVFTPKVQKVSIPKVQKVSTPKVQKVSPGGDVPISCRRGRRQAASVAMEQCKVIEMDTARWSRFEKTGALSADESAPEQGKPQSKTAQKSARRQKVPNQKSGSSKKIPLDEAREMLLGSERSESSEPPSEMTGSNAFSESEQELFSGSVITSPKKKANSKSRKKKVEATANAKKSVKKSGAKSERRRSVPTAAADWLDAKSTGAAGESDNLDTARKRLLAGSLPATLPCRQTEFTQLKQVIGDCIRARDSRSIYISGVPGTGKTATVRQVIRDLRGNNETSNFLLVDVNGMHLIEPSHVFADMHAQLSEQNCPGLTGRKGRKNAPYKYRLAPESAERALDALFAEVDENHGDKLEKCQRQPIVMIVDELDLLCAGRQRVLYRLFDWPTRHRSQLVLVAIANTLDLPERMLDKRVYSRLGVTRVTFQPYTHVQIEEIISARLDKLSCVDRNTIQFAARKVAAVSGDVRKALEICRRAVDVAVNQGGSTLTLRHVRDAVQQSAQTMRCRCILSLSTHEMHTLNAICSEVRRRGLDTCQRRHVRRAYGEICAVEGLDQLPPPAFSALLLSLASRQLIVLHALSQADAGNLIRLNVSVDEVEFAAKIGREIGVK